MISFKDYFDGIHCHALENPSVKVHLGNRDHALYLKFNSQDILVEASYAGTINPWLGSLCSGIQGKHLSDLLQLGRTYWEETFKNDQFFWDLYQEEENQIVFYPLELLHAALDIYRGKDYHYKPSSSLVCRCFGVRENDVLNYIKETPDPTVSGLSEATKAAMGCRSCLTQLKRWLEIKKISTEHRYFKDRPRAKWLLEMDYLLKCFPHAEDWKMEIKSFKGDQIVIEYNKDANQKELEKIGEELQDFLAAGLDPDLNFFLARS